MSISAWNAAARALLNDGARNAGASFGRTVANNLDAGVGRATPDGVKIARLLNQADEGLGKLVSGGAAGQPRAELAEQAQNVSESLRAVAQIGNNPVAGAAKAGHGNAEKLVAALRQPEDLTPALRNPMLDEAGEAARNLSNDVSEAYKRFGTESLLGRL